MANQTYSIDLDAPIVNIESPVDGAEFDIGSLVDIRAYYSDAKSGISNIVLKVDGSVISDSMMTMTMSSLWYTKEFEMGHHNIELVVTDHVMNTTTVTWSFVVTDANVDLVINDISLANNPIDFDAGEMLEFKFDISKTADINITLYDFAGKEVMKMSGSSRGVITCDGRTGKGIKLARGVYFARVAVSDGRSYLERIIKIAVK
ncbi:MAG: hypothetical protein APR54_11200 [Candidatus Cloacimonas sp. SDB]|nr:MAG: hypothetical protein APR54_11200 [Candidatus Cloacimonas sp. SDB]